MFLFENSDVILMMQEEPEIKFLCQIKKSNRLRFLLKNTKID